MIELMIAVAAIGILAAIAFPAYQNSVIKSKRTAAKAALSTVAAQQEAFFGDRRTYASKLTQLGYGADTMYTGSSGEIIASKTDAAYAIAVAAGATSTTYTLNATPVGSQVKDADCKVLTIDQRGTRSATGSSGASCW